MFLFFFLLLRRPLVSTLFPYTTLFRSCYRDLEARVPMEKDSIVRIYSMSKPITSVAVMMLFEEGLFKLDDPIGKYIPELKDLKVYQSGTIDTPQLADTTKLITIKNLLTHTSGMTYDFTTNVVDQMYKNAKLWESASLKEFIGKLSKLPLVHEPGEKWTYSVSIDVLGYLV